MTKDKAPVLTEDCLKRLYEMMDETDQGSFWVELTHMERHGFDIARQRRSIRHFIDRVVVEQRSAPDRLTDGQEREIGLHIRRRLREEIGLPALSASQEETWKYTTTEWVRGQACEGEKRAFNTADIDRVINWLALNDPILISYIKSVTAHNEPLGYNGGPNDRLIIRANWAARAIIAAAAQTFSTDCPQNVNDICRDVWDVIAQGEGA